ncbi:uncharacterized protein LOC120010531 [Tripterygium wilfordii]|uniref:uncharacterized protein LOC120010531 n=1 Tax=Tripterygium wilfordii TaxID=458696 RepID=UPI0018F81739|nr:uncharacterized protein LOC120010531 [Tripterygium wilfordii]
MTQAPILRMPDFEQAFEVACDASHIDYQTLETLLSLSGIHFVHRSRFIEASPIPTKTECAEQFNFVIKHKAGKDNRVADALSRRSHILVTMENTITGFEHYPQQYADDVDFSKVWKTLMSGHGTSTGDYVLHDGFLFRNLRICVQAGSIREFLILELHEGGLARHFGIDKTLSLVEDRFFWPHLRRDLTKVVK